MLRGLFEKQRTLLNHFFDSIDLSHAEKILAELLSCSGVVIFSGVGKSGHIAQKIATTFASIGTRATFLSPAHALHGDIGFVSDQDLFFAFSKSGESEELLALVPHIKKKGARTIAAVSQESSRLAALSDLSILLPVQKELCPYNVVPTLSTAVQLLFGDSLAIALMQAKQFTLTDFAANHPAGFLGKKITIKVADLMLQGKQMPICFPSDRLIDALPELTGKRCGCVLVCDDREQLKGIFTDGDLRRAIQMKGPSVLEVPIGHLMTPMPLTTEPHQLALHAIGQMEENPSRLITVLPVLEQGKVVGLLRMHDILQAGLIKEKK